MKNEKATISAKDYGSNTDLEKKLTMHNNTLNQNEIQFNSANPPKVLKTIHCHNCHNERELDGYIFRLVPVCAVCRTASELKILSNRIERRVKK